MLNVSSFAVMFLVGMLYQIKKTIFYYKVSKT